MPEGRSLHRVDAEPVQERQDESCGVEGAHDDHHHPGGEEPAEPGVLRTDRSLHADLLAECGSRCVHGAAKPVKKAAAAKKAKPASKRSAKTAAKKAAKKPTKSKK